VPRSTVSSIAELLWPTSGYGLDESGEPRYSACWFAQLSITLDIAVLFPSNRTQFIPLSIQSSTLLSGHYLLSSLLGILQCPYLTPRRLSATRPEQSHVIRRRGIRTCLDPASQTASANIPTTIIKTLPYKTSISNGVEYSRRDFRAGDCFGKGPERRATDK
jgi:hypothetical protein